MIAKGCPQCQVVENSAQTHDPDLEEIAALLEDIAKCAQVILFQFHKNGTAGNPKTWQQIYDRW